MRIRMLNVLNRMLRNEFECWNNGIAQSHHHSSLNWMTVLQTWCIFCEFERHKFRFDWRQCKIECWENEIEWQIGCAWPKSSKLNAHKMNLVDKITKLTGKTYTISGSHLNTLFNIVEAPFEKIVELWSLKFVYLKFVWSLLTTSSRSWTTIYNETWLTYNMYNERWNGSIRYQVKWKRRKNTHMHVHTVHDIKMVCELQVSHIGT